MHIMFYEFSTVQQRNSKSQTTAEIVKLRLLQKVVSLDAWNREIVQLIIL
jgi:hypothetical protein